MKDNKAKYFLLIICILIAFNSYALNEFSWNQYSATAVGFLFIVGGGELIHAYLRYHRVPEDYATPITMFSAIGIQLVMGYSANTSQEVHRAKDVVPILWGYNFWRVWKLYNWERKQENLSDIIWENARKNKIKAFSMYYPKFVVNDSIPKTDIIVRWDKISLKMYKELMK